MFNFKRPQMCRFTDNIYNYINIFHVSPNVIKDLQTFLLFYYNYTKYINYWYYCDVCNTLLVKQPTSVCLTLKHKYKTQCRSKDILVCLLWNMLLCEQSASRITIQANLFKFITDFLICLKKKKKKKEHIGLNRLFPDFVSSHPKVVVFSAPRRQCSFRLQ